MKKHWSALSLGILISSVGLYYAFRHIDGGDFWSTLLQAQLGYAIPFLALLVIFYGLKVHRWQILLASTDRKPKLSVLVGPMTIGFAANNLLPFRVGELIRLILASRSTGINKSAVLGSLVVERIFDLIAILLLGAFSLSGLARRQHHLPYETHFATAAFALLLLIFLSALNSQKVLRLFKFAFKPLPARARRYLEASMDSIEPIMIAVRSPWRITIVLLSSLLQWGILCLTILLSCMALGVHIPLAGSVYVMILITIGISLPSTPGFIGIIEYCFVLGLSAFDVPGEQALAAAIFYHVLTWLSITSAGTVFLRRTAMSWNSVRDVARTQTAD